MTRVLKGVPRSGFVQVPSSKSQAHRLLICAALGEEEVHLALRGISDDIAATVRCLTTLGADIREAADGFFIKPLAKVPQGVCHLYCGESGSTLRFLLPLVGALGAKAVFHREGRLPERPLSPLAEELCAHGMKIESDGDLLLCEGKLCGGAFSMPGNISSQYISGLLLSLPRLDEDSTLQLLGRTESAGYIALTEEVLQRSEIRLARRDDTYHIRGAQRYRLPQNVAAEGDYSNAAFFLCMGALSERGVTADGLLPESRQGDKAILDVLAQMGAKVTAADHGVSVSHGELHGVTIDAAQIPDLIPTLCVLAAAAEGETHIINGARLRAKESDRIASTAQMLRALGIVVTEHPDGMDIVGGIISGGTVDSAGDHRIAMAAAVASCAAHGEITVRGSACVRKSYTAFWNDFAALKEEDR